MQKDKIYIFSGLGADVRVFKYIRFCNFEPVFIRWEIPRSKETIENYAKRITNQITDENPIIIGISYGGIMAIEISKLVPTKKIILLSTAKTKHEIPTIYKLFGKIGILKIIPTILLKKTNFITYYFFGIKRKEDKKTLKEILSDTDSQFLKWALNEILNWKNTTLPDNYIHIHGSSDKILPFNKKICDIEIINGGHLMTLTKADELNQVINRELDKI